MTNERRGAVLDASALLALINSEPGAGLVAQALLDACISAVNLSEMAGKLVDKGVSEAEVDSPLGRLEIDVIEFDRTTALAAAALRRVVPRFGPVGVGPVAGDWAWLDDGSVVGLSFGPGGAGNGTYVISADGTARRIAPWTPVGVLH